MEEFLREWGVLGVVLGILATGIPFVPIPEELPVVVGGVLVGNKSAEWWKMLPACVIAVVIGDAMLYGAGRLFGPKLLTNAWIRKYVLPPERLAAIENNFAKHGIKILLFARLTPGIRAPIFMTAGLAKLPLYRFVLADGLYAIPGVALLFFLGYWFTDSIIGLMENIEHAKHIIIMVAIVGVVGYFLYRFLRRPIVTGNPDEVPPIVEKVQHTIEGVTHTLESVTTKIMHPKGGKTKEDAKPAAESDNQSPAPAADPAKPPQQSNN